MPKARGLQQEKPLQWKRPLTAIKSRPHSLQQEKSTHSRKDPPQPKTNKQIYVFKLTKLHDIFNRNIKEKGIKENHKNDQRTINEMARTTCTSIV